MSGSVYAHIRLPGPIKVECGDPLISLQGFNLSYGDAKSQRRVTTKARFPLVVECAPGAWLSVRLGDTLLGSYYAKVVFTGLGINALKPNGQLEALPWSSTGDYEIMA